VSLDLNPDEPPLLSQARVVRHVANHSMGLELENVAAADSEKLQEFLAPLILQSEARRVA
jgi:hypothetical protein